MGFEMKVENMAVEAEVLRSLALAVYESIYNGSTGYEEFDGALHAVFCMAHDHMKHMRELTDEAYALRREEREIIA